MLYISPSRIARYFYHECERYLIYNATPKNEKLSRGIPSPSWDYSPVTKAILEGGYMWEEEVVSRKIKEKIHIAGNNGAPFRDRVFDEKETLKKLNNIKENEYLYQSCLMAPPSFYKKYGLNNTHLTMAACYPDLIYTDKNGSGKRLRVIDVKASDAMKTSHKVQVTLYSLILSHILKEEGIKAEIDLSEGGVWTYGKNEPEWFNMNTIKPQVEEMLSIDLPRLSEIPSEEAVWHLHYRCEWCEYYDFCRKEAEECKNVSLLPYLTPQGKKYLSSDNISVKTLDDMKNFLHRPDASELLSCCASLAKKENRLLKSVEALLGDKLCSLGSSSLSMPIGENIKLLLTVQKEPVSGAIYTCALLRSGNEEVFGTKDSLEKQFVASSPSDCDKIRKDFIETIYDILKKLHDYNDGKEWKDQKSLQTYVFDSYEWNYLRDLLMEGLKDESISQKALSLLFYFHSEDLFSAEEHPETEASFPVVILTGVIRSLFALPVPLAYQLSPVMDVMVPDKKGKYTQSDYFTFALSNALRSDAIHSVWHEGKSEKIEWIENELKKRLWSTLSIINGLRKISDKSLFIAWPPKFTLPPVEEFKSPTLSRLSFIVKYESIMNYLSLRSGRVIPIDERERNNTAFRLTAIDEKSFYVTSDNKEELGRGDYILSEDNPQGDIAQMTFPDFFYKDKMFIPKGKSLYGATINEIKTVGKDVIITPALKKSSNSPLIIQGNKYLIHPRFMDWNSDRVFKRLREIDEEGNGDILTLLEKPLDFCKDIKEDEEFKKSLLELVDSFSFTDSQKNSFIHLLEKSLTIVWGPPGTGKTHFIALSLLCILEGYRKEGKSCRIYLSAFTHTAIENCLKKLITVNEKEKIWGESSIVKLGNIQTQGYNEIDIIPVEKCNSYLKGNERCIVGGTVYSPFKAFKKDSSRPFDMVVLDEGSQVRVAESLMPLSRVREGGRILIAGDDKQLPPIIQGNYPPPADGEPLLHSSIFECLKEQDKGHEKITCQLLENFRMNETLCRYPALQVYGEKYKSADNEIAARSISISGKGTDPLVEAIIDPSYPLVVCAMEGIRSGAENVLEASIVADITSALRERLCLKGQNYEDTEEGDALFWKKGLFIVSPHHVQIKAIRKSLEAKGLRPPFFVDTVDKMQGQECDAVIISYGVSDPELAVQEGEFIYSLNRLNVAITRGRGKSIVFLSRHLLTPTLQVLENQEAVEGISFMIGLERFARESGNFLEFNIGGEKNYRLNVYRR